MSAWLLAKHAPIVRKRARRRTLQLFPVVYISSMIRMTKMEQLMDQADLDQAGMGPIADPHQIGSESPAASPPGS